ncbi:MAG: magnesium chelatase [Firmicutes bacterium]|nr:magnesium chelatase [Bacillota bacterium]
MRSYTSLVRHEGNKELFLFTELSVIGLAAGMPIHLHVEGLRGTGKTTILRSACSILPRSIRIKGCQFNCDPVNPHCPQHRFLNQEQIAALGVESVSIPYLEISHSAKIGTVVGTLDLKRLTNINQPEAALLPGTLPQAHRGIVLVDEINRLADTAPELTDILLDAMGTKPGRVQIEENGLSTVSLPLQVSVWATSNPDEDPGSLADIRRQLSDRFDFMIQMGRPKEVGPLLEILSPTWESPQKSEADRRLSEQLMEQAKLVGQIKIPAVILESLAEIYLKHHFESLRALEAVKTGAVLAAAHRGAYEVTWDDVLMVVPAALRHRLTPEQLVAVLQDLQCEQELMESPAWAAGSGLVPMPADRTSASLVSMNTRQKKVSNRWWSKIVAWWNKLVGRQRDNGQQGAAKTGAPGMGNKPIATRRSSSSGKMSPLDMPLVTPPTVAQPLLELDVVDAVTLGEANDGSKK